MTPIKVKGTTSQMIAVCLSEHRTSKVRRSQSAPRQGHGGPDSYRVFKAGLKDAKNTAKARKEELKKKAA